MVASDAHADLIRFADEVPTTVPAVEAILERLEGLSAEMVARQAFEDRRHEAAARILLAGLLGEVKPPADLAVALAPYLEDVGIVLWLVASAKGDRTDQILSLCATEQLSHDREAAMLFLATEVLDGKPAPPLLRTRIRLLARSRLDLAPSCLLAQAALATADEDVMAVAEHYVVLVRDPVGTKVVDSLRRYLREPLRSLLPERPPEEVESGYTIQRDAPKVGRNDPCPCGSGKKYKRCCGGADPSPQVQVTPKRRTSPYSSTMTMEQFGNLRSMELVRLDPEGVATEHLLDLMRKLSTYRFFDEAARALDELARRPDRHQDLDIDGHWIDLYHDALDAGQIDFAVRLFERLPPEHMGEIDRLMLDLAREEPGLLGRLDALVDQGLRQETGSMLVDVAFGLLRHAPALGLLVARGVLDPSNALDAITLLEEVEKAQDRLLLAPDDSLWDLYERMEEHGREERFERRTARVNDELAEEVEDLRARVTEEAQKARAVEVRLREQKAALERAHATLEARRAQVEAPAPEMEDPDPARVERLRKKVADLKALLQSSVQERRTLRRDLAAKTQSLSTETFAAPEGREREPEALEEDAPDQHPLRLPGFGEGFEASLESLPARIAKEAVRVVGPLAAGDPTVWCNVKRMKTAPDIRTVRLSLAWRMLFTVDADAKRLTALEVIHRSDLEKALAQHR